MNYKLALALKEAGFPQNTEHYYENGKYISSWSDYFNCGGELIAAPTLSELIEACGDGFDTLQKYEEGYIAVAETVTLDKKEMKMKHPSERGKTPFEAVAKLWLKLNHK